MNFPRLTPGTGCPFCSLKAKTVTQNNTRNALCGYFGLILGRGRLLFWKACCFFLSKETFLQTDQAFENKIALNTWESNIFIEFDGLVLCFWYFGKTQQVLGPSSGRGEDVLVEPSVRPCPCFCAAVYSQQTANLAWRKSCLSSPLCPAQIRQWRAVPVRVSMCWVRAVLTGWSHGVSSWIRPWRIPPSL